MIDGENAMIYTNDKLMLSRHVFKPLIDYLISLLPYAKTRCIKNMLSNIWGGMTEKNKKNFVLKKSDKRLDIPDDYEITHTHPCKNGRMFHVSPYQPYKKPYARIGPFITSSRRNYLSNVIEPFIDNVYRCHTDSFLIDNVILDDVKKSIVIDDKIGNFKIEKSGKCYIKNVCNIEWS